VGEAEARRLNEAYLHRTLTGRSFAVLKAAVTLDGRLGADGGDSRWISGEAARVRAHELRDEHDAVLVGRETVARDDPALDVRIPPDPDRGSRRDPVAVVVDSRLSLPPDRKLWQRARSGSQVLVGTTVAAAEEQGSAWSGRGIELLPLPAGADGRVDLAALLTALAGRGIDSVLVEGGGTLHTAMLRAGLYGRACIFVAPRILGGREGPRLVGDLGLGRIADAWRLADPEIEPLAPDVLISGRVVPGGED
jgi:diaminohydroxyphosphoribosylaminopyrimidine deaminase/5-amino-6-(5-phosphoribosylamino)uracil reductase